MSTLANGTEDLVGQNLTPAAAYAVVNASLQKLAQMNIDDHVVPFYGLLRDGQQRGKSAIAVETNVTAVEINVEGDAPSGSPLTLQLVVNGITQNQVFSLAAGQTYGLVAASPAIDVPAGQTVLVAIVNGNQSSDVIVRLKRQLMVL